MLDGAIKKDVSVGPWVPLFSSHDKNKTRETCKAPESRPRPSILDMILHSLGSRKMDFVLRDIENICIYYRLCSLRLKKVEMCSASDSKRVG